MTYAIADEPAVSMRSPTGAGPLGFTPTGAPATVAHGELTPSGIVGHMPITARVRDAASHAARLLGPTPPPLVSRRTSPRRRRRRAALAGAIVIALGGLTVGGGELWVRGAARGHVYPEASVPDAPIALVLGAQVYDDGTPSPFLAARLDIARRLLDAGRVRAILVSGDHSRWAYDEPTAMQLYLVARGVPARTDRCSTTRGSTRTTRVPGRGGSSGCARRSS